MSNAPPCCAVTRSGDWGVVGKDDAARNDAAVIEGDRILSAYPIDPSKSCAGFGDNTIWIITESDRSSTYLLTIDQGYLFSIDEVWLFLLFLIAIAANWKLLLTSGPYFAETLLKRLAPNCWQRLEAKWPPTTRRPVELTIMLLGVILAVFFAWRDEHKARINAETRETDNLHLNFELRHPTQIGTERLDLNYLVRNKGSEPIERCCELASSRSQGSSFLDG